MFKLMLEGIDGLKGQIVLSLVLHLVMHGAHRHLDRVEKDLPRIVDLKAAQSVPGKKAE